MLIVGLTGGIAAGKSTVSAGLAARGADVIDMDRVGHAVLEPDGRAHGAVVDAFGSGVLADDGTISRPALGQIVFGDPEALARLNGISHPAMNAELRDRLEATDADIVVVDMAILVESELGRLDPPWAYQLVITVEAPDELRIERAVGRGMDEADARRRVENQTSTTERRAVADLVIVNDSDEAALEREIDAAWSWLRRRAAEPVVVLQRWSGPIDEDDPDRNFKSEVALYTNLDPLHTLRNLSANIDVPVGALVRYVLARWATEGSAGLLEIGPRMVDRLSESVERAEAADTDEARLTAYHELRQQLSWLRIPLDDPDVYPD